MISPYAAGGGSDTLARILRQKLFEAWGQPVVVDNRPGSGGIIGAETVARATPDGYTLFVTPSAVPHVRSRRLRGIAISSARRYGPLPDIPTISESGLPGHVVESFCAVVAPAGTPRAIIAKINA